MGTLAALSNVSARLKFKGVGGEGLVGGAERGFVTVASVRATLYGTTVVGNARSRASQPDTSCTCEKR